ncbi:MAG: 2'-5' RNA ligase family protein [Betaproteobacteria bacterium]|nr:MAG: 2'-5' RNA ligase family protein [Betaproteobacteria bacterium]
MAEIAMVSHSTLDQTVLLVPAFRLTAAIEQHRRRFDPTAVLGMPAHVTIMFPFLPDRSPTLEALLDLLASVDSFEYSLTEVRQFEDGTVYLAPQPSSRFVQLTDLVSEQCGLLPYRGAYSAVVPHLTVATTAPGEDRTWLISTLQRELPLSGWATQAWVMVRDDRGIWKRSLSVAFGAE